MHPVFRTFKRHYHKVRKLIPSLIEDDPFKLEVKFNGSHLRASTSTPDEDLTVRFIVLMRRFLNSSDPIYYENVWAILQEEFLDELPDQATEAYESSVDRLRTGFVGVTINGENITPERIYQTLSEAEYFGRDEEARRYLNDLSPIAGPLFWNLFYIYTLAGFKVVSVIFSAIRDVERTEKYKALYEELPVATKRCIYCLRTSTDAEFTSEEHIFPESLGNDELVLPKGYVCDACNHGVLSILDKILLEFGPVAILQVMFVPFTKAGKLPKANLQNVRVEKTKPNHIEITPQDDSGQIQNKEDLGNEWVSFNILMRGKRFVPKSLARALYKIGLGLVALSQGHEQACRSEYAEAREFISDGTGFSNNLLICTKVVPTPQVTATYLNLSSGTPVFISIYGIRFMFNLETAPTMTLNEQLKQLDFESYTLV